MPNTEHPKRTCASCIYSFIVDEHSYCRKSSPNYYSDYRPFCVPADDYFCGEWAGVEERTEYDGLEEGQNPVMFLEKTYVDFLGKPLGPVHYRKYIDD